MNLPRILSITLLSVLFSTLSIAQPQPPDYEPLDKAARTAIVDSVAKAVTDFYVFPDKGQEMAKLVRRNLKKGTYDEFTSLPEFTERLTKDLLSVCHDLHLHVDAMPPEDVHLYVDLDDNKEPDSLLIQRRLRMGRSRNFGFEKIEHMTGNVGYIKLNGFIGAQYAGMTAIAAMNFVAYCDALIFDLRENGGGDPSMIQLITSYLFDEPKHLNSFFIRDNEGDYTEQYWSHAYVSGPRLTDIPVYVLTSENTFSAAEEFSYNLQNMERAAIVGDTTGGGAHPINSYAFPELLILMRIPYGRAVNPISKTNWEGVGVIPDIPCKTSDAREIAHLDALKKLRDGINDERRLFTIDWAISDMESKHNPVLLSTDDMRKYAGDFGPRHVRIEDGKLIYQRDERPPFEMIPMGNHLFRFDDLDFFHLECVIDDQGICQKLIGHYNNGHTDECERDK